MVLASTVGVGRVVEAAPHLARALGYDIDAALFTWPGRDGDDRMAAPLIDLGAWQLTGDFTTIDLIAASTNALNGAILARRPDHYKNFTVVGIIAMALIGGLGGGITRDILLNKVPSALTNPAYITLCLAFGVLGYLLAYGKGQLFREGPVPVHDQLLAALVRGHRRHRRRGARASRSWARCCSRWWARRPAATSSTSAPA